MKYTSPKLVQLGTISHLTLGGGGSRLDGSSKNPTPSESNGVLN